MSLQKKECLEILFQCSYVIHIIAVQFDMIFMVFIMALHAWFATCPVKIEDVGKHTHTYMQALKGCRYAWMQQF